METYLEKIKAELEKKGLVYLKIKVLPKANQTEFRELMEDETLKIAIKAPPVDGKANQVLGKFLKKEFGVSEVVVVSGKTDRVKLVKLVR